MQKYLNIIGWIIIIGSIILGIYIGSETAEYSDEFNFISALLIWLFGAASSISVFSFIQHLDNQEKIINNQTIMIDKLINISNNSSRK